MHTPFGERWQRGHSRFYEEGDSKLGYYRRHRAFNVVEVTNSDSPKKVRTTNRRRRSSAPAEETGVGEAEASPPREPSQPDVDEEGTDEDDTDEEDLLDDSDLKVMLKDDLIEYAESLGLDVDSSMTKAEIRKEVDELR